MKKKCLICLGIILTLLPIMLLCCVASIKRTPATLEQYISVMNKNNVNAVDSSDQIPENQKQRIYKYGKFHKEWLISDFVVYDSINTAEYAFQLRYKNLIKENSTIKEKKLKSGHTIKMIKQPVLTKNVSVSNNHYAYESFHFNNSYVVLVRVENTFLFMGTIDANQENIDSIIKELGYHFGNMPYGISGVFFFAEILSLILICLYLANIFKKHNIRPWMVFIPFVNAYYLCKIADKNGWKILFFIIPFFGFIYYLIVAYKLARIYSDNKLMCFAMGFLPLILLPAIAFNEPIVSENKTLIEGS